ncbi:MAG: phosphoribosylamine--glycine ligase [Bacteroidales bacterium]|nr:phosphoribosylamine--glycine ligase [Bacteroidales bacterium]
MYPGETRRETLDWKAVQGQHITAVERRILVLGSGGREHALAWKLAQSEGAKVFIAPGNAGTAQVGVNVDMKLSDFESIKRFCLKENISLVVVGPEQPLVDGIVDFFRNDEALKAVRIIGPDKRGAQLEGSKAFAKDFMEKYGVPTAKCFKVTKDNLADGLKFLETVNAPYVLKADGLAAGKGVLILNDLQEAKDELAKMLEGKFGAASATVVIEEFLKGIEVSVFVLTDGEHYILLPEAKDYKRIGDGDTGLNTGGMGAVSPVPFCTSDFLSRVEERIVKPTLKGLKTEGVDYKGFIFLGLMNDGGNPYVIEYNVRMGDPETEAVMTRIEGDFADLLSACADGRLDEVHYAKSDKTAVTVMMVSGGYPEAYEKGKKMSGLDGLKDVVVFHAGTAFNAESEVVTSGGRVIAVTAHGDSIEEARAVAYREVEKIRFEGMNYRHDIGLDLMKMQ